MEFNLIVEYPNYISQTYCSCVQCFIDGRKVENVESMVFDAKGQAKEGAWYGSFVVMLFHTVRIKCFSIWAIDMMVLGKLEL